ncbi:LOW QUALITY PROTEIN: zinc finger homeobox protein 3-like, partial [Lethenteron reissneri]|uniref:LOW QUALITY PROTEIN: zinc finger homeobox protein 3-like n=1 Tax=Lethenteron reissneri TaxID=7753 RepID=UPI002AB7AD00
PRCSAALAAPCHGSGPLPDAAAAASSTFVSSAKDIRCKQCSTSFPSLQSYMEHHCPGAFPPLLRDEESEVSEAEDDSDVENLTGDIVYHPDGSAYIVEKDKELCKGGEGGGGGGGAGGAFQQALNVNSKARDSAHPQIVSTFHIASSLARRFSVDQATFPNTSVLVPGLGPVLHSFRVFDVRHKDEADEYLNSDGSAKNSCTAKDVPTTSVDLTKFDGCALYGKRKPILMCFLCKLSFGYVRSFATHAAHDHQMTLIDEERRLLASKNVSAIIQGIGKDREPLISFLEPKTASFQQATITSTANLEGPRPNFYGVFSGVHVPGMEGLQAGQCLAKGSGKCNPKMTEQTAPPAKQQWGSNALMNLGGLVKFSRGQTAPSASLGQLGGADAVAGEEGEEKPADGPAAAAAKVPIKSEPTDVEEEEFGDELYANEFDEDDGDDDSGDGARLGLWDSASSNELSSLTNQSISQTSFLPQALNSSPKGPSFNSLSILSDNAAGSSELNAEYAAQKRGDFSDGKADGLPDGALKDTDVDQGEVATAVEMALCRPHRMLGSTPPCLVREGDYTPESDRESPKCDFLLSHTALALGGHLSAAMQSRNSCKTLKCPKCNWHYKYQQTLEAHMKEKHPEPGDVCNFCTSGQAHPRLARGESYTCGYKPFRCDVCNYSTTTKGNLSIHMQSDKHLNNMQSLQNGGPVSADQAAYGHHLPSTAPGGLGLGLGVGGGGGGGGGNNGIGAGPPSAVAAAAAPKARPQQQKPVWRCEVCDYETNVARNLRIHMTSEKHAHNLLLLQQSMKTLQHHHHHQQQQQQQQQQHGLQQLGLAGLAGGMLSTPTEAELYQYYLAAAVAAASHGAGVPERLKLEGGLSDAQQQQLLLSGFQIDPNSTGGALAPTLGGELPLDMRLAGAALAPRRRRGGEPSGADNPALKLFLCGVCNAFSTDGLEALAAHASAERRLPEDEWKGTAGDGAHACRLCQYSTPLRANFQLHCKTDKHVAKYQLVAHLREGGHANQWRLKCAALGSPVQLKCNACDYYTNSLEKLGLHVTGQRHEASLRLYK